MSGSTLSEQAYQHIKKQVFSGKLVPGDRLVNRSIAQEIGASFIPVREAIGRLASEGIVEQVAGAGAFVRLFDRQEIAEIYDARELIEPYAAARAARHITDLELAELKSLLSEWQNLGEKILTTRRGATTKDLDHWLTLNERFHEIMIHASRNRFLAKITANVHVLSQCFAAHRSSPKILSHDLVKSTLETHRELVALLEAGDESAAQALVRKQLEYGRDSVLSFLDQARS